MRKALTICAIACAALACTGLIAACGSSDEGQVKDALSGYEQAVNDKDYTKICTDYISPKLAKAAAKSSPDKSCSAALKQQDKATGLTGTYSLAVGKVKVDGDKAVAEVKAKRSGHTTKAKFRLQKDGDQWKIAGLAL